MEKNNSAEAVSLAQTGWRLLRQNRFVEAWDAFQESLRFDPQNYCSMYGLGWVCFKQGDLEGAIQFFEQACVIRPDAFSYAALASTYFRKKSQLRGTKFLLKALWIILVGKKPEFTS